MGTLLRGCVKEREAIELPFGVMSGVDPDIGILDGVHIPQGEGEVFLVHWFE